MEDRIIQLIAAQDAKIKELAARVEKLESVTAVDGVVFDSAPEYVRDYISKGIKPQGGDH